MPGKRAIRSNLATYSADRTRKWRFKFFRLQASNNHYIPEENSMAFVFPET